MAGMYDERSALQPAALKPLTTFQLTHAFIICLTGFQEGYMLCVINSLLPPIQRALELCFPCDGGDTDAALAACTCPKKSLVVSVLMIGAAFGGLAGGQLADTLGRKPVVLLSAVLAVAVAGLCSTATPELVGLLIAGRTLAGVCIGAGGTASIALIAETAPREHRGALITAVELSLCVGCVVATLLALALGDAHWRVTMALPASLGAVQLVSGAMMLHESPAWLEHHDRNDDAIAAKTALGLAHNAGGRLRYAGEKPRAMSRRGSFRRALTMVAPVAGDEGDGVADGLRDASSSAGSAGGRNARALCLAVGCALAHSALAANAVLYYSRDILQSAGVAHPLAAELFLGLVKCVGVLGALMYVDRVGRKPLLLVGNLGALFGHLGLASSFSMSPANPLVALGALCAFIFFWELSWAGLMYMVAAEMLPVSIRGLGLGLVASVYWMLSFGWAFFLEALLAALGPSRAFGLLAVTTFGSLLFVIACVTTERRDDATSSGNARPASAAAFKRNASTSFQHLLAEDREAAEPETDGGKEGEGKQGDASDRQTSRSSRSSRSVRDADSWREVNAP